jgi:hypothetical protein
LIFISKKSRIGFTNDERKKMRAYHKELKDMVYVLQTGKCDVCKKDGSVDVTMQGLLTYNLGGLVQDAFPDMDKALREQIISGTHPDCWDLRFGKCETA